MTREDFERLIAGIAAEIEGRPLDRALTDHLNRCFPPAGSDYRELADACRAGIAAGWLCNREHGGIRYGRIIKPGAQAGGCSVDVVLMEDIAGPRHRHPNGEIDLIIPETPDARFDGCGAGWLVYPPGSAHEPTVSGGRAIILYLLPEGAIEFTPA